MSAIAIVPTEPAPSELREQRTAIARQQRAADRAIAADMATRTARDEDEPKPVTTAVAQTAEPAAAPTPAEPAHDFEQIAFRPMDEDIIACVAERWGVSFKVAAQWIADVGKELA